MAAVSCTETVTSGRVPLRQTGPETQTDRAVCLVIKQTRRTTQTPLRIASWPSSSCLQKLEVLIQISPGNEPFPSRLSGVSVVKNKTKNRAKRRKNTVKVHCDNDLSRIYPPLDDTRLVMTTFAHQLQSCVFLKQIIN